MGKVLGAALIAAAALRLFAARQRSWRQETQLLRELAAALEHMAAAIRWQRTALPELLAAVGEYPLAGAYFRAVLCAVERGEALQSAWREVFSGFVGDEGVLSTLELGGDEEKLTGALTYGAEQLKERLARRQDTKQQTLRLWLAGTLSAAGLLIILLI